MTRPATEESTFACGLRLALSMLTVFPIAVRRVDRQVGGVAMSLAPAVGALVGVVGGAIGCGVVATGSSSAVAAALVILSGTLLTRSLHLDGLADTADALGSYRNRLDALDIMKKSDIGPFGVGAIVLVLLLQVTSLAAILTRPPVAAMAGVVVAAASGRAAVALACRRGIPAARDTGLGALVAGTVAAPTAAMAALGLTLVSIAAIGSRPWQGPLVVLVALGCSMFGVRHVVRRLGGVTGDVLGASVEVTETLVLVGLALGPL